MLVLQPAEGIVGEGSSFELFSDAYNCMELQVSSRREYMLMYASIANKTAKLQNCTYVAPMLQTQQINYISSIRKGFQGWPPDTTVLALHLSQDRWLFWWGASAPSLGVKGSPLRGPFGIYVPETKKERP